MSAKNIDRKPGRSLGSSTFRNNYHLDIKKGILRELKTANAYINDGCCPGGGSGGPITYTGTAVNDAFTGTPNSPITGTVATNDTPCSPGNTAYQLITDSVNGTTVLNPDGSFTFTPLSGFTGTTSFTVGMVCDDNNVISSSTTTLTYSYTPPSVVASFTGAVDDLSNININITGTFDSGTSTRDFLVEYLTSTGTVASSETLTGNAAYAPYNVDLSALVDFTAVRITANDGISDSSPVTVDRCTVLNLADPATYVTVTDLIEHGDGEESWTIDATIPANVTLNILDGAGGSVVTSFTGTISSETFRVPATPGSLFLQAANFGCTQAGIETLSPPINFVLSEQTCILRITNRTAPTNGITNIEYQISIGGTLIETINTTDTDYDWGPGALYAGETLSIQQAVTTPSGGVTTTQSLVVPAFSGCVFEFQSNAQGADTFNPFLSSSGQNPYWRMPDDSYIQGSGPNVLGSTVGFDGSTYTIKMLPTNGFAELSAVNFEAQSIVGAIDFSQFANIGPGFSIENNPSLTGITNPSSAQVFTAYQAFGCDLTGTLDLSPLTNIGGNIQVQSNPNLTDITISTTQNINDFFANACNLGPTLDLSNCSNLGGDLRLEGNSNLTGVTFPTSTRTFTRIQMFSCNITGTLDFTNLSTIGGVISIHTNPLLTGVDISPTTETVNAFFAQNCDITGVLDVSMMDNFGGSINLTNNNNLTGITLPASSSTAVSNFQATNCDITGVLDLTVFPTINGPNFFTVNNANLTNILFPPNCSSNSFLVSGCGFTGTLDISNVTGLNATVVMHTNAGLTDVIFPTNTGTITNLQLYSTSVGVTNIDSLTFGASALIDVKSNSFNAAEVNEYLDKFLNTLPNPGTGSIIVGQGSGNSAPDGTSGGFDGLTAAATLATNGWTVTTT